MNYSYSIFDNVTELPQDWDKVAKENIFFTTAYLKTLEEAPPNSLKNYFIGVFDKELLVGISVGQFINLNLLSNVGDKGSVLKKAMTKTLSKLAGSKIAMIGNNLLSGIEPIIMINTLTTSEIKEIYIEVGKKFQQFLKSKGERVHLTTYKDFDTQKSTWLKKTFSRFYLASVQPNMIFTIPDSWTEPEHYQQAFTKKYRDHYKRIRKKGKTLITKELNISDIELYQDQLYKNYITVVENAAFNTFYLHKSYFYSLKKRFKEALIFKGYFEDSELVGFSTLVVNGQESISLSIGYDRALQRSRAIYHNMMFDMAEYCISNNIKHLILGRTALEIKSSIGAKAHPLHLFIKHHNPFINIFMRYFFTFSTPKVAWKERHPFKTNSI